MICPFAKKNWSPREMWKKQILRLAALLALCSLITLLYFQRQSFMQDKRIGSLVPAGKMSTLRSAHSATLLRDGKVLVAGGMERAEGDEVNTASAELYDPSSNAFKATGPMTVARAGHTATLLPTGDVLITGGFNEGVALASAEVYQADTHTFTTVKGMSVPRDRHAATLLKSGLVLVTGGCTDSSSKVTAAAELFDPSTKQFTPVGDMLSPRCAQAATLLTDGSVLVTGGSASRFDDVLTTAELYNPVTRGFVAVAKMTTRRHKHASTLLPDGRVLINGGSSDASQMGGRYSSAEVYDPKSKAFVATGNMTAPRFKMTFSVVSLLGGKVFVSGDGDYVEIYDPAQGVFGTADGKFDGSWMYSTATVLVDGRVLILGGYNRRMTVSSGAWIYTPTS